MKVSFSGNTHATIVLPPGRLLCEKLDVQNSPVLFGCRTGICGTCLVEVEEISANGLPPPSDDERELLQILAPENARARLACQIDLQGDIRLRYLGRS